MSADTPKKPEPRYFARPDEGAAPLGWRETVAIVLWAHLGVRTRAQRTADAGRANGLHLFIAGAAYFVLLIAALIVLVNCIAG